MNLHPIKLITAFLIFLSASVFSYAQTSLPKTGDSIQITQLKDIILSLPKSFKNFSIGSGNGDQIFLNGDGKKTEISYIQQTPEDAGWFSKLKDFAMMQGYEMKINEAPDPKSVPAGKPLPLPTISFKEKDREAVYERVKAIMLYVFKNNKDVYYQLIMPE